MAHCVLILDVFKRFYSKSKQSRVATCNSKIGCRILSGVDVVECGSWRGRHTTLLLNAPPQAILATRESLSHKLKVTRYILKYQDQIQDHKEADGYCRKFNPVMV